MSYSNYRNNMPHYNSMPYSCDPINMSYTSVMPPYRNMYIANNYPPMPFMTNNAMPTMPNIPYMPTLPEDYFPFIPDSEMNCMPNNAMPSMPQFNLPDGDLPALPAMPSDGNFYPEMQVPEMNNGTMPTEMTCEQLMEMMRRMNCNMEHMDNMNNNTQNRTTTNNTQNRNSNH